MKHQIYMYWYMYGSDIHVLVHVWFIHTYDMISQTLTIMYKEHILAQMTIYNYMYMFVMQLYQI